MIDLWGVSFTLIIPTPFDIGISVLLGSGTYLGKNAVFSGFAGVSPPGVGDPEFGSISPSTGAQESTVPVTLTARDTTFRDDPPVNVAFVPNDGLTVGAISTTSNTEIEFDLTIADNAPTTVRSVTVSWDDPPKTVTGDAVFTVTAKP